MPFIFNEDLAMKLKLQGLMVYDVNNPDGLAVPVRFRLPEDEIAAMTYPMIVIEVQDISFAADRQFSGGDQYFYAPEGYPTWWAPEATEFNPGDSPYRYDVAPTAYNIVYRVSVYSRLVRDHLIPLTGRLMQHDKLTARGAYLDIPQDGTFRHMTLLSGPKTAYANVDDGDNQKRFVTSSFLVSVPTEVPNGVIDISPDVYARCTQIKIDLTCYQDMTDVNLATLDEKFGLVSSGAALGWNTLAK